MTAITASKILQEMSNLARNAGHETIANAHATASANIIGL